MKLLSLKVGDTLVFDHSDYRDYGIIYAVSENGTKAHAAFVDDGGGEDCLWLMGVELNKKGIICSEGNYDVNLDNSILDKALNGSHMEMQLVELFEQAAYTPEEVSFFLDDDMNKDDELSVIHDAFETLRNEHPKFREVYEMCHALSQLKEIQLFVPEASANEFGKEIMELCRKYNVQSPALRAMMPIKERVKTFEDACNELGSIHCLVAEYNVLKNSGAIYSLSPDIVAYMKLRIIAAALNEGWEPQFTTDEYRWYPWFTFWTEEELKGKSEQWKKDRALWLFGGASDFGSYCGLAYANSLLAWSFSYSYFSARLAVKSEELATYFGKQFISIWADYVGPFNRKEA